MNRVALFLAVLLLLAACTRSHPDTLEITWQPVRPTNSTIETMIVSTVEAVAAWSTAEARITPTPRPAGATVTGQVIRGYGDHGPVVDLPLWIGAGSHGVEPATHTAAEGRFTLTGLPTGTIQVRNSHLDFQAWITSSQATIDLGLLKYPLFHPPNYYWWTAAPLPSLDALLEKGQTVEFNVCLTHLDWQRPSEQAQGQEVWSRPPFNELAQERLQWWFERPASVYNSIDQFEQSVPGGPDLDPLGTDWRYLLGLWNAPDLIADSACAYDGRALQDLLLYRQVEVWLIGYQATLVQRLAKDLASYEGASPACDPAQRSCVERTGDHFAIHVVPVPGYQVIRFPGVEDVLDIHIIENGQEILKLQPGYGGLE